MRLNLLAAVEEARRRGFFGPRGASEQLAHAQAFVDLIEAAGVAPAPFLDLGSGGGLPGLVLAARWAGTDGALLDASARRTGFLRETVAALGWDARIRTLEGRGEALGRQAELRGAFPVVVARSFGAPAVTAEIGSAFLGEAGALVVSEPEENSGRWPDEGLQRLGLRLVGGESGAGATIAVLRRIAPLDERWPRAVGIPGKRPLW